MKHHTKLVLDDAMDRLLGLGLSRKRRGLCIWAVSPEMWGGINLGHQERPDGTLLIHIYPQVYWEPIEKIYCYAVGRSYKFTGLPTRSRLWSLGDQIEFGPDCISQIEMDKLVKFVKQQAIPKALELCDHNSILEHYRSGIPLGGHNPERYLSIRCWQEKSTELDVEFDWVMYQLKQDLFVASLREFYAGLQTSSSVANLLRN